MLRARRGTARSRRATAKETIARATRVRAELVRAARLAVCSPLAVMAGLLARRRYRVAALTRARGHVRREYRRENRR